jgi:hypothetical protein
MASKNVRVPVTVIKDSRTLFDVVREQGEASERKRQGDFAHAHAERDAAARRQVIIDRMKPKS